jgi:hypothetical protein
MDNASQRRVDGYNRIRTGLAGLLAEYFEETFGGRGGDPRRGRNLLELEREALSAYVMSDKVRQAA